VILTAKSTPSYACISFAAASFSGATFQAGESDHVKVGISNASSVSKTQKAQDTFPPPTDNYEQLSGSRTTHNRPSPNETRKRLSGGVVG
jgi:hypothetical protein